MRIDRIATFIVDSGHWKNWLFVRIDTSDGVHGWGEAFTEPGRERAIAAEVEAFGARLIGRDPADIRALTSELAVDGASRRRSLEFCSALSGLEIALWDIAGKVAGQPVFQLLGGTFRDRVPVYANCHDGKATTPDAWADLCAGYIARGFGGVKIYPITSPIVSRRDETAAVEIVAAVRAAIGPDARLMIDCYRMLTPATAIRLAGRLAEFDPFWFEEPVPSDNLAGLAEIRARSAIPVLSGESLFGKVEFRDLFTDRAADIINPDVCNCGGIVELVDIAAWAEPNLVSVAPHNWNSLAVGLAATLQASACIRDLLTVEHISAWEERSNDLLLESFEVTDGTIRIPTGPGLGVDLDERALAHYPMQEYSRLWPE